MYTTSTWTVTNSYISFCCWRTSQDMNTSKRQSQLETVMEWEQNKIAVQPTQPQMPLSLSATMSDIYLPIPVNSLKNIFIWLCQVLVAAHRASVFFSAYRIFSFSIWTLSCGMWYLIPGQGSNPSPLHWEHRISVIGLPAKSCHFQLTLEHHELELHGSTYTQILFQ